MLTAIIISGPVDWLIATGTVIAALIVILKPVRGASMFLLSIRDQWMEITERLDALEQLKPNGGSSVADQVSLLRSNQDDIIEDLKMLRKSVDRISRRTAKSQSDIEDEGDDET